jgi:ABC-2 type transport system ATP-binding protein
MADDPRGGEATIAARGLRKAFGAVVAVEGLTLRVRAGEVVGLLGPNGAGKTTAIRMLTTVLAPTAGSFAIAGIPHTRPQAVRGRIGVLPESAGFPGQQTAAEHVRYHAELSGRRPAQARAQAASLLADVGLADCARTPTAHLSRGMRQRLGIARALVNDPAVVFLDEPTLGLDPAGQDQVLGLVQRIARERAATVILSTHVLAEVEETCSRVVILNRGRVVADGTVGEVTRRAAAPRRLRVRVPDGAQDRALAALARVSGVADPRAVDGDDGWLSAAAPDVSAAEVVRALADAQIAVLAFEVERPRLRDAFLSMTAPG